MSEKKYYVKLKSPNDHRGIWWCGDRAEWQSYSDDPIYRFNDSEELEVIGQKVSKFIPSFTKSKLAEIMDGALYIADTTAHLMGEDTDFLSNIEWINPLIELVPVEDGE